MHHLTFTSSQPSSVMVKDTINSPERETKVQYHLRVSYIPIEPYLFLLKWCVKKLCPIMCSTGTLGRTWKVPMY